MTEAQWLSSDDPKALLGWITVQPGDRATRSNRTCHYVASERKLRLWMTALAFMSDDRHGYRRAYEPWTDGQADPDEPQRWVVENATSWANEYEDGEPAVAVRAALLRDIFGNPFDQKPYTKCQVKHNEHDTDRECKPLIKQWLTWNNGTVPKLAQVIYAERRFEDMPLLADALEEAGCADEAILAHCRGQDGCPVKSFPPGAFTPDPPLRQRTQHVRGCWVLDLLLGKE